MSKACIFLTFFLAEYSPLFSQNIDYIDLSFRIKGQEYGLDNLSDEIETIGFNGLQSLLDDIELELGVSFRRLPVDLVAHYSVMSSINRENDLHSSILFRFFGFGAKENILEIGRLNLKIGVLYGLLSAKGTLLMPISNASTLANFTGDQIFRSSQAFEPNLESTLQVGRKRIWSLGFQSSYHLIINPKSWVSDISGSAVDLPRIRNDKNFSFGLTVTYRFLINQEEM